MAYVNPNAKTKEQLKEWLALGREIEVYQPGLGSVPLNGTISLEGPHYPAPHTWYAVGVMDEGKLIRVR